MSQEFTLAEELLLNFYILMNYTSEYIKTATDSRYLLVKSFFQLTFTCSKLKVQTLGEASKYVQR